MQGSTKNIPAQKGLTVDREESRMLAFIQHQEDSFHIFPAVNPIIQPGPFDPPDKSLPSLNITALSYSWTTWRRESGVKV